MSPPRGFDDDSNPVPTVEPVFFDDAPEPTSASAEDRAELFRKICDILEAGPDKSAAIRIAALRRVAGFDASPLRESARKLGCSHTALADAVKAIQVGLKSDSF